MEPAEQNPAAVSGIPILSLVPSARTTSIGTSNSSNRQSIEDLVQDCNDPQLLQAFCGKAPKERRRAIQESLGPILEQLVINVEEAQSSTIAESGVEAATDVVTPSKVTGMDLVAYCQYIQKNPQPELHRKMWEEIANHVNVNSDLLLAQSFFLFVAMSKAHGGAKDLAMELLQHGRLNTATKAVRNADIKGATARRIIQAQNSAEERAKWERVLLDPKSPHFELPERVLAKLWKLFRDWPYVKKEPRPDFATVTSVLDRLLAQRWRSLFRRRVARKVSHWHDDDAIHLLQHFGLQDGSPPVTDTELTDSTAPSGPHELVRWTFVFDLLATRSHVEKIRQAHPELGSVTEQISSIPPNLTLKDKSSTATPSKKQTPPPKQRVQGARSSNNRNTPPTLSSPTPPTAPISTSAVPGLDANETHSNPDTQPDSRKDSLPSTGQEDAHKQGGTSTPVGQGNELQAEEGEEESRKRKERPGSGAEGASGGATNAANEEGRPTKVPRTEGAKAALKLAGIVLKPSIIDPGQSKYRHARVDDVSDEEDDVEEKDQGEDGIDDEDQDEDGDESNAHNLDPPPPSEPARDKRRESTSPLSDIPADFRSEDGFGVSEQDNGNDSDNHDDPNNENMDDNDSTQDGETRGKTADKDHDSGQQHSGDNGASAGDIQKNLKTIPNFDKESGERSGEAENQDETQKSRSSTSPDSQLTDEQASFVDCVSTDEYYSVGCGCGHSQLEMHVDLKRMKKAYDKVQDYYDHHSASGMFDFSTRGKSLFRHFQQISKTLEGMPPDAKVCEAQLDTIMYLLGLVHQRDGVEKTERVEFKLTIIERIARYPELQAALEDYRNGYFIPSIRPEAAHDPDLGHRLQRQRGRFHLTQAQHEQAKGLFLPMLAGSCLEFLDLPLVNEHITTDDDTSAVASTDGVLIADWCECKTIRDIVMLEYNMYNYHHSDQRLARSPEEGMLIARDSLFLCIVSQHPQLWSMQTCLRHDLEHRLIAQRGPYGCSIYPNQSLDEEDARQIYATPFPDIHPPAFAFDLGKGKARSPYQRAVPTSQYCSAFMASVQSDVRAYNDNSAFVPALQFVASNPISQALIRRMNWESKAVDEQVRLVFDSDADASLAALTSLTENFYKEVQTELGSIFARIAAVEMEEFGPKSFFRVAETMEIDPFNPDQAEDMRNKVMGSIEEKWIEWCKLPKL